MTEQTAAKVVLHSKDNNSMELETHEEKRDVAVTSEMEPSVGDDHSPNNVGPIGSNNMESVVVENRYAKKDDSAAPAATSGMQNCSSSSGKEFSLELLPQYYKRLFPFDLVHQWLSYENGNNSSVKKSNNVFSHREFSFTIELAGAPGEEVYIRYQSFQTANDLATAVTKRLPTKIDIGAIFSHPPVDHCTVPKGAFQPAARELVFDIDLTDYDSVRHCGCSGANICKICWKFMNMAVAVVDEGLRTDFGFEHIGWFYSGRRGIHCWVCDERARDLTDAGRSAVASYFNVPLGTDENKDIDLPETLPPALVRARDILEPMFVQHVLPSKENGGHGLLALECHWKALLETLPLAAAPVREKLLATWSKAKCKSSPAEKWTELKTHLRLFQQSLVPTGHKTAKHAKKETTLELIRLSNWCTATIFKHTYPRLDINVSKMRNHLLKSPFCVHPKTGRVCVPIRIVDSTIDESSFDPFTVPTLAQLVHELDHSRQDDNDNDNEAMDDENEATDGETLSAQNSRKGKGSHDWEKTSLKQYYDPFVKEFLVPLKRANRRARRDRNEQEAAAYGDF